MLHKVLKILANSPPHPNEKRYHLNIVAIPQPANVTLQIIAIIVILLLLLLSSSSLLNIIVHSCDLTWENVH